MQIKLLLFFLLLSTSVLNANVVGRLFDPNGDVTVIHNDKIYTVYDRFRLYKNDLIILKDSNSTVKLFIYKNGSIMYPLVGNTSIPVNQYLLLLDNKKNVKEER